VSTGWDLDEFLGISPDDDELLPVNRRGIVYLLHFHCSIRHNAHYLGFSVNLEKRLARHRAGTSGVNLMKELHEKGIGFELARTWENVTVLRERQLKKQGGRSRLCPLCRPGMRLVPVTSRSVA